MYSVLCFFRHLVRDAAMGASQGARCFAIRKAISSIGLFAVVISFPAAAHARLASERVRTEPRPSAEVAQTLPLAQLRKDGAIVWGNPRGQTVTVFSNFSCGYCRALSKTLRSLRFRVVERPVFGAISRKVANQVYCSENREAALHKAYSGEALDNLGDCDTSGLDANERFARSHGLNGVPIVVRSDGVFHAGYLTKDALKKFVAANGTSER